MHNEVVSGMEPPPSFTSDRVRRRSSGQNDDKNAPDDSFQGNLTKMVWDAGSKQVRQAFGWYTNIDMFRPYFDVSRSFVFDLNSFLYFLWSYCRLNLRWLEIGKKCMISMLIHCLLVNYS